MELCQHLMEAYFLYFNTVTTTPFLLLEINELVKENALNDEDTDKLVEEEVDAHSGEEEFNNSRRRRVEGWNSLSSSSFSSLSSSSSEKEDIEVDGLELESRKPRGNILDNS